LRERLNNIRKPTAPIEKIRKRAAKTLLSFKLNTSEKFRGAHSAHNTAHPAHRQMYRQFGRNRKTRVARSAFDNHHQSSTAKCTGYFNNKELDNLENNALDTLNYGSDQTKKDLIIKRIRNPY